VTRSELDRRADALAAERIPFVSAIVVRVRHPASVRPGDSAIVRADGTIEGFVGGVCAETSVRLHALRVLETGEALLLRILPEGDGAEEEEGAVTVANPCLSGGGLELFLEPRLPAPRIAVLGETPIGLALQSIGERAGFDVEMAAGGDLEPADGDAAVVVASHGRGEEAALARALRADVPYVGLVASRKRGAAVVEELRQAGVTDVELERLRTPAGLDIGAVSPEEIAIAVLAQIVATRRSPLGGPPATATDPVCGMTVAATDSTLRVDHDGRTVWFCGEHCRDTFAADPDRYVAAR
jgi:xanthine dehydrogenase accessory factor